MSKKVAMDKQSRSNVLTEKQIGFLGTDMHRRDLLLLALQLAVTATATAWRLSLDLLELEATIAAMINIF